MRMQTGPLGEMSYLQPDHFENEKKNMSEFLSQNPLVMLARTCQNIGLEHHKSSERSKLPSPAASGCPYNSHSNSLGKLNLFSMSHQLTPSPTVSAASSRSCINLSTAQHRLSPPTGFSSPISSSTTTTATTFVPPISSTVTPHDRKSLSGDEADLQAHPSSDSLIQLARLSSSLKLSGDRQKRNKPPADSSRLQTCSRGQKRVRRQSFSRPSSGISAAATSKPIDFTVHPSTMANSQRRSNTSTPSTSSSVSPSSLRSSPPAHSTSPFSSLRNGGAMLDLTGAAIGGQAPSSATSALEMFYTVGNALGASPERLRELLVTVAQALMDRSQSSTEAPPQPPPVTSSASAPASSASPGLLFEGSGSSEGTRQSVPQHLQQLRSPPQPQQPLNGLIGSAGSSTTTTNNNNDPSTQCLCCGLMCADMNSLVQHIYSHLPPTSQSSKPPQPSVPQQPLAASMHSSVSPLMSTTLASSSSSSSSYCSSPPFSTSASLLTSAVNPIFEIAANYARYFQKLPSASLTESSSPAAALTAPPPPPAAELTVPAPPPPPPPATDPNALFLAWMNMFRPSCATEALAAVAAAHRFG